MENAVPGFHLAQLNIARARAPMDSALMADFVAQLDAINALADAAPGFVWRLQGESGNATAIRIFDDALLLVNLSVWESIEALFDFTYKTLHAQVMARRKEWFERLETPFLAMWWIPAGHLPDALEAKERLELLQRAGPTADAFNFKVRFSAPDHTAAERIARRQSL